MVYSDPPCENWSALGGLAVFPKCVPISSEHEEPGGIGAIWLILIIVGWVLFCGANIVITTMAMVAGDTTDRNGGLGVIPMQVAGAMCVGLSLCVNPILYTLNGFRAGVTIAGVMVARSR